MRQKEGADCQWLWDRGIHNDSLLSFFGLSQHLTFCFFFVTPHLYALILSVRLTFLLLIPCLLAVSVTLSYI